jgi:hypothetical protein
MRKKLDQLISYVQSSLYLLNEAYNEICHITQTPNTKEEYEMVSGHPFSFYGVTLNYCFVMEYNKLLDTNSSNDTENVASLYKLNKAASDFLGDDFKKIYKGNKKVLNDICKSALCIRVKDLRNKKFGHSDDHAINNPWKVEGFTGEQIIEMGKHVTLFLEVANKCFAAIADFSFGLHNDDRTANFIRYHAKYKQYYFKNFMKAEQEGYGLR